MGESISITCEKYSKVLCEGIRDLYQRPEWSDMVLSCNGNQNPLHKFMISIFAPKLINRCDGTKCNLEDFDIDIDIINSLLEFLYTGQVTIDKQKLKSLLQGAQKFGLQLLEDAINEQTVSNTKVKLLKKRNKTNSFADEYSFEQKCLQASYSEFEELLRELKVPETDLQVVIIENPTLENGEDNPTAPEEAQMEDYDDKIPEEKPMKTQRARIDIKCPKCDFKTILIELFNQHMFSDHSDESSHLRPNYKCRDCEFTSKIKQEVGAHRRRIHFQKHRSKVKSYKCQTCDFITDKKKMYDRHMQGHSVDRPIKCEQCDYRGKTVRALYAHRITHRNDMFECRFCEKVFRGKFVLNKHVKMFHVDDKVYSCEFCPFKTRYPRGLKRHVQNIHDENWIPVKEPDKQNFGSSSRLNWSEGEEKACSRCDSKFQSPVLLVEHLAVIHHVDVDGNPVEKNRRCKQCDFTCYAEYQLRNHYYQHHAKTLRCDQCHFTCKARTVMDSHVNFKHLGLKTFMCETCGLQLATKSCLSRHSHLHRTNQAFLCNICGKSFALQCYLVKHMKLMHEDTTPKQNCPLCPFTTKLRGNLTQHIQRKHKEATT